MASSLGNIIRRITGGCLRLGTVCMKALTIDGDLAVSGTITGNINVTPNIVTITESTLLTSANEIVLCNGIFTVSLLTAVGFDHELTIKNTGTGDITINTNGSETIDDDLTIVLAPGNSITIVSNQTNWKII